MNNITFEPKNHIYHIDELECLSVSQLLQSFGIGDCNHIPAEVLRKAADFGTKGHLMARYLLEKRLNEKTLDSLFVPYLNGVKKFMADYEVTPVEIEQSLGYKPLLIAGTPDVVGRVKGTPAIIDWKFVKKLRQHYHLQLGGYMYLFNAGVEDVKSIITQGFIVRIYPNNYEVKEVDSDSEEKFKTLLYARHIIEKNT